MKTIVALDAFTLSPLAPGEHSPVDPSWDAISDLGALTLYPRTKAADIVSRAAEAEIVLTNKAPLSRDTIAALPRLEYIGVMATGYNIVDLDAARERGITVTNVPGYGASAVAQHVFALLLELVSRVGATDAAVKNGDWVRCPDFCFTVAPIRELAGKTLGIAGFGAIGQAVARIGAAFGMRIAAFSRSQKPFELPVEWVTLDELFAKSDVITLHCPLTDETRGFINRENLAKCRPATLIINTGRGPLIDEPALAEALKTGVVAGFGADVLSTEPPAAANPLLSAPNTVITPHVAWASIEARSRLMEILAGNLRAYLAGAPLNVVSAPPASAAKALAPAVAPAAVVIAEMTGSAPSETSVETTAPEETPIGIGELLVDPNRELFSSNEASAPAAETISEPAGTASFAYAEPLLAESASSLETASEEILEMPAEGGGPAESADSIELPPERVEEVAISDITEAFAQESGAPDSPPEGEAVDTPAALAEPSPAEFPASAEIVALRESPDFVEVPFAETSGPAGAQLSETETFPEPVSEEVPTAAEAGDVSEILDSIDVAAQPEFPDQPEEGKSADFQPDLLDQEPAKPNS